MTRMNPHLDFHIALNCNNTLARPYAQNERMDTPITPSRSQLLNQWARSGLPQTLPMQPGFKIALRRNFVHTQ